MKPKLRKYPKRSSRANNEGQKVTSYDTSNPETATPQKVTEGNESSGEFKRQKAAEGKPISN